MEEEVEMVSKCKEITGEEESSVSHNEKKDIEKEEEEQMIIRFEVINTISRKKEHKRDEVRHFQSETNQ